MVSSNAAVAKLTAPTPCLNKDTLLNFIVHLLPAHQVTLATPKKGSSITLSINQDTTILTERNAILRTLCGLTLHNRLDNYPYCLLGGYAEAAKASPEASMVLASIASYMSVASMIRSGDEKEENIVQHLDEVLGQTSFLVGSTFRPTLADYDIFFALQEKGCLGADGVQGANLKRWTVAVQASVEEMLSCSNSVGEKVVPKFSVPSLAYDIPDPVPVLFYGDEEHVPPAPSAVASSKPNADAVASNKNKIEDTGSKKELTDEEKKAAAEKRAKKNEEKAKKKAANAAAAAKKAKGKGTAPATELDVTALDIRVGKIIEVWEHAESEKLWCEKITFGEGEPRQILSGLRHFYKKEEMQDRMVLVLCNLKQRNLVGVPSHGMVLCATNADHSAVEFVVPPEGAKLGERVMFEGLEGEPKPENQVAKKKILEKLAPDLRTNGDGVVVWKGAKSSTTAGPCVASKGMKDAQVS